MAREVILAAGGIVLRREQPPLVAVVRLRKRDEWVLPKGKLDSGETPRAAAKREVLEETGHHVTVHEFLGTLVLESGGRAKVVHYWRMEASGAPVRELMSDVRAVDWLPLDAALARLSRASEQAFLANVGPLAVASLVRKLKAKAPAAKKRRTRPAAAPPQVTIAPSAGGQAPMASSSAAVPQPHPSVAGEAVNEAVNEAVLAAPKVEPPLPGTSMPFDEADYISSEQSDEPDRVESDRTESDHRASDRTEPDRTEPDRTEASTEAETDAEVQRRSLAQKVRDWLGRAA
jgi:8-oxo-dGTP diphosphatase